MKQFKLFALVLAIGAMLSVTAYAQKGPATGGGDPGSGGTATGGPNHFGLTDSCWKVFLAGLSSSDQATITADEQLLSDNQSKMNDLEKQIGDLVKSGGRGGRL